MTLEQSEGTIYGVKYYAISPIFPAHAPTWFKPEWNIIVEWCIDTYGPTPEDGVWTPAARWYVNNAKFWFRNERDMLLFLLKWQ
jgi:hypothetical protein